MGIGLALGSGLGRPCSSRVVVLAIGYGYDLRFKGTAWSWLPFAVGIPLLPVFGWVGATGGAARRRSRSCSRSRSSPGRPWRSPTRGPTWSATRRPGSIGGGRDSARAGRGSFDAGLLAIVVVAAVADPGRERGPGPVAVVAAAIAAAARRRSASSSAVAGDAGRRERAWEIQAVGVALLAAGLAGRGRAAEAGAARPSGQSATQ